MEDDERFTDLLGVSVDGESVGGEAVEPEKPAVDDDHDEEEEA